MPALQEFLASFAVDIDLGGVDRLQKILSENRDLANSLAAAFSSARTELASLLDGMSASLPSLPSLPALSSAASDRNEAGRRQNDLSASLSEISTLLSRLIISRRPDADPGSASSRSPLPLPSEASAPKPAAPSPAPPSNLNLAALLDLSDANETLKAFQETVTSPLPLSGDASGILSSAETALTRLKSRFASTVLTLKAQITWEGEDKSGPSASPSSSSASPSSFVSRPSILTYISQASSGGRFSSRRLTEVAEDGSPEYVIPVQKEQLALPLLRQLFSELSASARESILTDLSERGEEPTPEPAAREPFLQGFRPAEAPAHMRPSPMQSMISSFLSSISNISSVSSLSTVTNLSSSSPVTHNETNTVQAPVNIQVTSSEASAQSIGEQVYDAAERTLLRTLKGVFA